VVGIYEWNDIIRGEWLVGLDLDWRIGSWELHIYREDMGILHRVIKWIYCFVCVYLKKVVKLMPPPYLIN